MYRSSILEAFFKANDWEGAASHLSSLTHSQHRQASVVLARMAAQLPADTFWEMATALASRNAKAYLGTLLKAAPASVGDDFAAWLTAEGTETDLDKTIVALLPRQQTPADVEHLFSRLGVMSPRRRAHYIVSNLTWPSAFILFQSMRQMDSERDWLLALCRRLIKDGTTIGWTLASLARAYFDLPELRGTFSLTIEPYEMSRIENSYEAFCRMS